MISWNLEHDRAFKTFTTITKLHPDVEQWALVVWKTWAIDDERHCSRKAERQSLNRVLEENVVRTSGCVCHVHTKSRGCKNSRGSRACRSRRRWPIRGVIHDRGCCVLSSDIADVQRPKGLFINGLTVFVSSSLLRAFEIIAEVQRPKGRFITDLNKPSDLMGSCNERIQVVYIVLNVHSLLQRQYWNANHQEVPKQRVSTSLPSDPGQTHFVSACRLQARMQDC
ncbi:hypothetical protein OUZ56_021237 [Daphnia magna]|uniref:Uncharacterized protein n=1 Tax=Daphnia magna TaxID=35525 RepID=A0ABQ9ZGV7_9CRUS|nr:hypothetical protein OUZ56_021237 [Daphnia magna]